MSATSITLQLCALVGLQLKQQMIYLSQPYNILYYTMVSIKLATSKLTRPIKVKTIFYDVMGHGKLNIANLSDFHICKMQNQH